MWDVRFAEALMVPVMVMCGVGAEAALVEPHVALVFRAADVAIHVSHSAEDELLRISCTVKDAERSMSLSANGQACLLATVVGVEVTYHLRFTNECDWSDVIGDGDEIVSRLTAQVPGWVITVVHLGCGSWEG